MIEKFISIQNVGLFRDCKPKGDVSLKNLTLVFAENGRGKTTLCAILRSLQSGKHEFISERKTVGTRDPSSIQLRIGGTTHSFTNNTWSTPHPDIAIFDSVFIHENVYAGDYVEHDHKKNLYRVIVGTHGVQLARQIEDLDGKIRESSADIRIKKEAVSNAAPNGIPIDAFLNWQVVPDINTKIREKAAEISNRQRAIEKSTEIQARRLVATIQLPSLPSDFTRILAKQLTDITADAEARVRQHIARHQMGNQGEPWLSQGLGYVRNDQCPFCGQGIQGNDLISAYRSQFNAAYKALKQEVAQLSFRVGEAIGDAPMNTAQQTISGNLTLIEFWKQFVQISIPAFPVDEVRSKYARLRELALALAQKKQDKPINAVALDDEFTNALDNVQILRPMVNAYNAAIAVCNTSITAQKASVQRGADIEALKRTLADLQAKKRRFEPDVAQRCQHYQAAITAKVALEGQKESAKQRLDQHCQNILGTYEETINSYLDQFNTGFRITNSRHLYTGGTPSSHYQIQINNRAIDLGDSRTQAGIPCFKTTLSAGDRSALAFAFFLAALKQEPQIGRKIVVLDDPFTSQDRFRRTCTEQLIRQLATSAEQVIVLSHDPSFLKQLWDGYAAKDIKVLQLCRAGDNTVIVECDIQAETQAVYLKNYSTLLAFYRDRTGNLIDVARAIRPFLEGMLRAHFPGRFQPTEWLGDFLSKIRCADVGDGLQHEQADLRELEAINHYSGKYHHGQSPNVDSEAVSPDELHGFVKRTLRLVAGC